MRIVNWSAFFSCSSTSTFLLPIPAYLRSKYLRSPNIWFTVADGRSKACFCSYFIWAPVKKKPPDCSGGLIDTTRQHDRGLARRHFLHRRRGEVARVEMHGGIDRLVFVPCGGDEVTARGEVTDHFRHGRRRLDVRRADDVTFLELIERSEEHTSELQSLMRISYAVF